MAHVDCRPRFQVNTDRCYTKSYKPYDLGSRPWWCSPASSRGSLPTAAPALTIECLAAGIVILAALVHVWRDFPFSGVLTALDVGVTIG
ncbi:hypothetical protein BHE74_00004093 [Ensete ventricosum]|uniref:Uncharacterized protein n=1 Tax=Ensete ventricosum TaxID=4639 RepID=A0A427BAK3_ENSVE|nr:hypothetical protein B296_00004945 [Ensete ventricosum]RWW87102.1 hypothetical protein BHE74_00004093 [Ensete ventricosum]